MCVCVCVFHVQGACRPCWGYTARHVFFQTEWQTSVCLIVLQGRFRAVFLKGGKGKNVWENDILGLGKRAFRQGPPEMDPPNTWENGHV